MAKVVCIPRPVIHASQLVQELIVKILFVSSEVVPFSKTGGLADVAGSLPIALKGLGHDIRVVTPLYRSIDTERFDLHPILTEIDVHFPRYTRRGYLQRATFPDTDLPVYFVQQDDYFGRATLYGENGRDYIDNPERFAFFCLAVLWMLKGLDWQPDIIHCNDWQTALIPTYLHHHPEISVDPLYKKIRTLFTIHNLAYQCVVSRDWMTRLDLPESLFTPQGVEFYGKLNFMKAGILYSDYLSTVSKQYAREIRTPELGAGLDGVLKSRASRLEGILNGIDTHVWNPERDTSIASRYSWRDREGKTKCKAALQKQYSLPEDPSIPLIGMVGRLVDQKGFDLVAEVFDDLMKLNIQLVILGTGEPKYHDLLTDLASQYPDQVGITLGFDNELAHVIEAGSDLFLMPSLYEPGGLNQLYSLKYGTIPIVRKTGGLADSIVNATLASIKGRKGTGFVFTGYTPKKMLDAISRAVRLFRTNPKAWSTLIENAMTQDFSWRISATHYEKLYAKIAK